MQVLWVAYSFHELGAIIHIPIAFAQVQQVSAHRALRESECVGVSIDALTFVGGDSQKRTHEVNRDNTGAQVNERLKRFEQRGRDCAIGCRVGLF